MRAEVSSLLDEHDTSAGFLDTPALGTSFNLADTRKLAAEVDARLPAGARVGPYVIARVLGQGGSATVYEARQDQPRRSVALKVVKPGVASAKMLRRFEYEAEVLGRLQHPCIAQIYEAGVARTPRGRQPYFAMELIDGPPLTEYAKREQLDFRARLGLMMRICDAVQHAHMRGVIHRDLKPGNILVDGSGQPRILDFGVARATDSDIHLTTVHTVVGELIGTIPYMSPEQCDADPAGLDTRSDVYAIGVIGYELLAGRKPYNLERKPIFEAVRIIREQDPQPLGTLDRTLRGDVETIFTTALAKDKRRRYQSAADLARDIERFLNDQPIVARKLSAMYRLRTFSRRHKALVTGVAAVCLAVFVGLLSTMRQANLAMREAQRKHSLVEWAESMLSDTSPYDLGRKVGVLDVLDKASQNIDQKFSGQPKTMAAAHRILGKAYQSHGVHDLAEIHHREALDLRLSVFKQGRPEVVQSRYDLGDALTKNGELAAAEREFKLALAARRKLPDDTKPSLVEILNRLARFYLRVTLDADAARPILEEARDYSESKGLTDTERYAVTLHFFGIFETLKGDPRAAIDYHRRALAIRQRLGEADGDSSHVAASLVHLATALQESGQLDAAERRMREALAMRRTLDGEQHPRYASALMDYAALLERGGRSAEAEPLLREALRVRISALGQENRQVAETLFALANNLYSQGRIAAAATEYEDADRVASISFPPQHWTPIDIRRGYGECLTDLGRFPQAEELLLETYQRMSREFGSDHLRVQPMIHALVRLYTRWGKLREADNYRARLSRR